MKRVAAVWSLIRLIKEQEVKLFPNTATDPAQQMAALLVRMFAYQALKELMREGVDDAAMDDFLSAEVGDLRLLLAHKIPLGFYQREREHRIETLTLLYASNAVFVRESASQLVSANPANKTLVKLLERISARAMTAACEQVPALCAER